MNEYYITCPRGLEETTSLDISSHIKTPAIPDKGGVFFNGSLKDMYTVNLYSRTGMFVLKKLMARALVLYWISVSIYNTK